MKKLPENQSDKDRQLSIDFSENENAQLIESKPAKDSKSITLASHDKRKRQILLREIITKTKSF